MKQLFTIMTKKDKIFAILAITFTMLSAVCDLLNPYFFSKILSSIQTNSFTPKPITASDIDWYYFGVLVGLSILSLCFCVLYTFFSVKLSMNMSTCLRMKLFAHTQELSSADIDKIGLSTLLTRITSDITNVQSYLLMSFTIAIKAICFIIGGLILSIIQLVQFNGDSIIWTITSAYGLIFIFFIIVGLIMKKGIPIFEKTRVAIDMNNKVMSENILGNHIIRAFNLENKQFKKYEVGNKNLRKISIKAEGIFSVMMPFSFFIVNLATILIILFAGIYAKDISPTNLQEFLDAMNLIGVIFSFIQYFVLIMIGLSLIGMIGFTFSRAKVSNRRIFEIINTEPSIKSGKKEITNGNIKFNNVSFAYETKIGETKNVLSNINLEIKQGQWLGIIGQTGSGKTTLVNLISRLYDVSEGEVLVSDINVKDIKLDSLRSNVSVSLQEKILLHGTIKSNILAGKLNATDKEIIEAAKLSESFEFIQKKENGLDSIVEQRGNNLSGGQKQRLSIARALIKKPKILIFDDSTSALDAITEKKIINNLYKEFKGTTVVIVSQKVRSIQSCDQIIVLDNGRIVQHGKHKDLMKNENGIYKKIYDSQSMSVES